MAKNILKGRIVNMLEEKAAFFNFRVWIKQNWKVVLVLVLLVCAAYWNSLGADFTSDDTRSILNNESLDKTSYILGQPRISYVIHFFINKIFGRVPIYYRLVNIISHTAVVLTAYLLFSILISPKAAFFTAAILAVHPIGTESVTWISGGPYALYTFFIVLALLLYTLSYKNKKLLKFSFIVFIFSLLTHDMSVAFPLVLFAFILSFSDLRKNWKDLIPFFTAVIIILLLYMGKIGQRLESFQTDFYQESQMMNPFVQIPIAITSYLGLIFWPKVLTLYHSELIFSLTQYFIRLALFIIFLGVVIYSFKKSRRVFFGFSLFLISLLPTLTPFGITWVVAERYVYLGSIGIFLVFALFINRLSKVKRLRIIVNVIFFLIIAALLARTIIRNIDWRNEDNLWIATGRASPSSPNTHNNLGDVYGRQGNAEKSIEEFKKAIEMKPNYADAYHNLANAYQGTGKIDEAIENYKKAIKFNPRLWQSYQNLGALYFNRGDTKLAEEYFKKVVQIRPGDSDSRANMGILYLMLGKKKEAKAEFQEALNIEPNNQRAREGLNSANQ